jgi:hypothetical protein
LISLGKLIGIHFVQENYVAPVFRLGMYHKVCGPGLFWVIPILESVGQPVKSGIRFTNLNVAGALSSDSIPIDIELAISFRFDPERTKRQIAAQLVRAPEHALADIAEDYADSFLRRIVAEFTAEEICSGKVVARIQKLLVRTLAEKLEFLGYVIDLGKGVLIKAITASPEFQQTMLGAKRYEVILRVLNAYQAADVDQALFAELVNGLAKGDGSVQFFSLADALNFPKAVRGNGH